LRALIAHKPTCFLNVWKIGFAKIIRFARSMSGLAELGFGGVDPEATGRPSYHPSVLLKLYIYGYLNRVQSSRRLEREAGRNVEVMWLTGRLAPDHKTIGRLVGDEIQKWAKVVKFSGAKPE
jgi:transposase